MYGWFYTSLHANICKEIGTRQIHHMKFTFHFRTEYLFNFNNTFEIHDDIEVLKRMGMAEGLENGDCPPEKLEVVKSMVPKALEPYVRRK